MEDAKPARKRWFRFRLRTFLTSTVVLSLFLAAFIEWFGTPAKLPAQKLLNPVLMAGEQSALEGPSEARIRRKVKKLVPITAQASLSTTLVKEYDDPPRVYPMIGSALQHHAIYDCIVVDGWHRYQVLVDLNHLQMLDE